MIGTNLWAISPQTFIISDSKVPAIFNSFYPKLKFKKTKLKLLDFNLPILIHFYNLQNKTYIFCLWCLLRRRMLSDKVHGLQKRNIQNLTKETNKENTKQTETISNYIRFQNIVLSQSNTYITLIRYHTLWIKFCVTKHT